MRLVRCSFAALWQEADGWRGIRAILLFSVCEDSDRVSGPSPACQSIRCKAAIRRPDFARCNSIGLLLAVEDTAAVYRNHISRQDVWRDVRLSYLLGADVS